MRRFQEEELEMELKGSKTEKNLQTAFAGESQAHTKYQYYASAAKKKATTRLALFLPKLLVMKKSMPNYGLRHCMAALFPRLLKI